MPVFSTNDFRFSGGTFLRALGGDGSSAAPYQLADIYGLQGMVSTGLLDNAFVLANSIDATGTANWSAGAGFVPIGNSSVPFTGRFDGQSHTLSNLSINRPNTTDVGLFGYAGTGSQIQNIALLDGNISGGNGSTGVSGGTGGTGGFGDTAYVSVDGEPGFGTAIPGGTGGQGGMGGMGGNVGGAPDRTWAR